MHAWPADIVVTVRGEADDLCPATEFFFTRNACEYAMHGRDGDYQCCPHGVTGPQVWMGGACQSVCLHVLWGFCPSTKMRASCAAVTVSLTPRVGPLMERTGAL